MIPAQDAELDAALLPLAERMATMVLEGILDSLGEAHLPRMTVLIGHQLMLMGQVFADGAGMNFPTVFGEELERAGRWHNQIVAAVERRGLA